MPTNQELTNALDKAKIGIMSEHSSAFICTILFSLKQNWNSSIPTAGTDGKHLIINPEWFYSLEPKQRIFVLAHEAWHVAFDHIIRGKDYDKEKYNRAADYVINNMLDSKGYKLVNNVLMDHQYDNMSTEQVYKLLDNKKNNGKKESYDCDIMPITGDSPEEIQEKRYAVKDIIMKAATQSKISKDAAGTIPGDIKKLIDELAHPKLNWFSLLMKYMSEFAKTDYSFKKPNRRFTPDFYLPSLWGESMGDLALAFDASGSVSNEEFSMYYNETKYMRECMKPTITTIVDFDTRINNIHKLTQEQSMDNISFTGGGGTNLHPVFKYFKEHPPTVLIVFSDLYCSKIQEDPGFPVIWIAVNSPNAKVNFGTLIHCTTRKEQ